MIPKVIHLCWFSGEKYPSLIEQCIDSWKKVMPDYKIRLWDANSFDFQSVPFVKAAWEAKKWAFVTDYIRLYALYTEGGVYLDSDVKTFRRFDDFLHNRFFIGLEPMWEGKIKVVESAIMGSESGHPYVKECLDYYNAATFVDDDKFMWTNTCPILMTYIIEKYGFKYVNANQSLSEGIQVYDLSYFGHSRDKYTAEWYAIHYFNGSWVNWQKMGGPLFRFCKRNNLMGIYNKLAKLNRDKEGNCRISLSRIKEKLAKLNHF